MIIVCSNDALLTRLCIDLSDGQDDVEEIEEKERFHALEASSGDLVIVDLNWWQEEELPLFQAPAMALTPLPDYEQAVRLLQKGIRGYGNRHMLKENFQQAITAVRAGQVWLPPAIVTQMITSLSGNNVTKGETQFTEPLSKREEEVALHITSGLSNKEVAEKMHISVRTVKAHLTSIFAKTGYRDRLELALKMKK